MVNRTGKRFCPRSCALIAVLLLAPGGGGAQTGGEIHGGVTVGWQQVEVEGNPFRFGQYGIPPEDWFSRSLVLLALDPDGFPRLDASLWDWGEDVQRGGIALYGRKELSLARLWGYRARFYPEPQSSAAPPIAARVESGAEAEWRWPRNRWLGLQFRHSRATEPGIVRLEGLFAREDRYCGLYSMPVGPGLLRLHYQVSDYVEGSGRWPTRKTAERGLEYSWEGDHALATLSYASLDLRQQGFPTSKVTRWGVRGSYFPGSRWSLSGHYGWQDLDQSLTQNTYTTRSKTGAVEMRYRLRHDARLRWGYRRRDDRRLNTIQTLRHSPLWQIYFGEADWSPAPGWRLTGRAEIGNLNGNPPTAIPGTSDVQPLLYDRDLLLQLKVSAIPIPDLLVYAHNSRRRRELEARGISYDLRDWAAGALWTLSPRLSLDGSFRRLDWGSSNAAFLNALGESWIASLGANYQQGPLSVSGYYGRHRSSDATQVEEDQWALSLRYALSAKTSLEGRYSEGDYDSPTLPALGYRARVGYLGYRTTF